MHIKDLQTPEGISRSLVLSQESEGELEGSRWMLLPALIDPHVHFRVPGGEYKEDWCSGAAAAIQGGVTAVFDMPNTSPSSKSVADLAHKQTLIDAQLQAAGLPLRYGLYLGASKEHLEEIEKAPGRAIGIKVFMGSSTGNLLIHDPETLEAIFRRAAAADMVVAVHAEDEAILEAKKKEWGHLKTPEAHSLLRCRTAAQRAVDQVLNLAAKYGTRLYLLHVSTPEELALAKAAKQSGVRVAVEACIPHLFLDERAYASQGTRVQMNPPLRLHSDVEALWVGIQEGTVDTIGTDHAPHLLAEKSLPFGQAPSGLPGVEMRLPLLLNAVAQGKLTLKQLVALTRTNIEAFFGFPPAEEYTIVDLDLEGRVTREMLKSRCQWSPYEGLTLRGWPLYTIVEGRLFPALGQKVKSSG